jgi:hypothetical protein
MKYFHDRMNIFKRSWIIPVLFKHITKIFGENYLSLLRYTADQLWFLKIKSLQITLGLPQDPSRLLAGGEFGANGKCVYLFVIPCGPWGPGQIPDIRDTGAVIRSTTSLQGSRIRSQTWPWPSELGRHPHTPLLPSPRSGRLPWVETPGWDIMVCNGLCLPTSPSQREEQAATAGVHFSAQSTSCLSSGILCTPAPNFQPERETSWISEPRLPVCDSTHSCRGHFLSKTTQSLGHTPSSLLTLELMKKREWERENNLLYNEFDLSGFFPLWSWI